MGLGLMFILKFFYYCLLGFYITSLHLLEFKAKSVEVDDFNTVEGRGGGMQTTHASKKSFATHRGLC